MPFISLSPATFTTPAFGGSGFQFGSSGLASASSGGGGASQSETRTARWSNWPTVLEGYGPNDIQVIVGSFVWSANGSAQANLGGENGSASCSCSSTADIIGGVSGSDGFFLSTGASVSGPGPVFDSNSYSDSQLEQAIFTPNTLASISGARLDAQCDAFAESGIPGSEADSSAQGDVGISSPTITVGLTDRRIMSC